MTAMRFSIASESTPGLANEDYAIAGQNWAAVFDGATAPSHLDSGCIHDVRWLVHHLVGELARALTIYTDIPLADAVADAIAATCGAHKATCDLNNPDSPSSTVAVVRLHSSSLDYLALADSPILLDTGDDVIAISDDRTAHLKDYSYAGVTAARNNPGGFYVASTLPEAAQHAVQGSLPAESVRRVALLTDGASRLVDYFKQLTWAELLSLMVARGPAGVVACTRAAELGRPRPTDGRRRKLHDDATAILIDPV